MLTSAQLVEIMDDGIEVLKDDTADPVGNNSTYRLSQSINNIMLSRHNRRFVCRATNANGNTSISTTIQVFGELALLFDRSTMFIMIVSSQYLCMALPTLSLGVPDSINHATIFSSPVSLISRRFTFTAPVDNNAPITGYSYILCQHTCFNAPSPVAISDISSLTDLRPSFTIRDLVVSGTPYLLLILATNEAGVGPNSTVAYVFNSSSPGECLCIIHSSLL